MTGGSEKKRLNDSLIRVTALPHTMGWRNNTGMAWAGRDMKVGIGTMVRVAAGMKVIADAYPINFGLLGSGDIMGLTAGQAWALEIKDSDGQLRESQVKFKRAFERAGGQYELSRSGEQSEEFSLRILRAKGLV